MSDEISANELFFDEKEVKVAGPNLHDDFNSYRAVYLRAFAYRVGDVVPAWLDRLEFFARDVVRGISRDITKDAEEYLLLNRDPSQTMDVRVCFSEDYGTWAQIVGAESDAQAIRRTINKLDSIWVVCQPILEEFLAQYKPATTQEGTQAT